jgi:hypothetical protein
MVSCTTRIPYASCYGRKCSICLLRVSSHRWRTSVWHGTLQTQNLAVKFDTLLHMAAGRSAQSQVGALPHHIDEGVNVLFPTRPCLHTRTYVVAEAKGPVVTVQTLSTPTFLTLPPMLLIRCRVILLRWRISDSGPGQVWTRVQDSQLIGSGADS